MQVNFNRKTENLQIKLAYLLYLVVILSNQIKTCDKSLFDGIPYGMHEGFVNKKVNERFLQFVSKRKKISLTFPVIILGCSQIDFNILPSKRRNIAL